MTERSKTLTTPETTEDRIAEILHAPEAEIRRRFHTLVAELEGALSAEQTEQLAMQPDVQKKSMAFDNEEKFPGSIV